LESKLLLYATSSEPPVLVGEVDAGGWWMLRTAPPAPAELPWSVEETMVTMLVLVACGGVSVHINVIVVYEHRVKYSDKTSATVVLVHPSVEYRVLPPC
jgi:hypothetical protein